MPASGRKGSRTIMIGALVEPEIAAMVEQVAEEETRSKSTYLYRLVLEDLQRRRLISSSVQEPAGTYAGQQLTSTGTAHHRPASANARHPSIPNG